MIPEQLVAKAHRFATAALDDFQEGRYDFFALHAGTAFEALGKALLAHSNPVLLVDLSTGSRLSLLALAGVRESERVRTASAYEVFARVRLLKSDIELHESEICGILDDRNAAAHLTVLGGGTHRAFVRWVKATNEILSKLGAAVPDWLLVDPSVFWSDPDMVQTALSDYRTEVKATVRTKLVGARRRYESWRAGLEAPIEQLKEIVRVRLTHEDDTTATCPVCTFEGVVIGEVEWIGEDSSGGALLFAERFRCGVCRLHLVGPDEIETAGLETSYDAYWVDGPDEDAQ